MIEFVKFHPEHALLVNVQVAQSGECALVTPAHVAHLQDTFAFSGFVAGQCVGCAGLISMWPGRSIAWAVLSDQCGPHMRAIVRFVRQVLPTYPDRRIEATVLADFELGRRFVELCGFEREDRDGLRAYDPLGRTFALYARIKP